MSSEVRPKPTQIWVWPPEPFGFGLQTGSIRIACWDCDRVLAEGRFTLTLEFASGRRYTFADTRAVMWCHNLKCGKPNTAPRFFESAAEAIAFGNTEKERFLENPRINCFEVIEYIEAEKPAPPN